MYSLLRRISNSASNITALQVEFCATKQTDLVVANRTSYVCVKAIRNTQLHYEKNAALHIFYCAMRNHIHAPCVAPQECTMKVQEGKFKLQDLLVVPMQRVLKYHLLLKVGDMAPLHIIPQRAPFSVQVALHCFYINNVVGTIPLIRVPNQDY